MPRPRGWLKLARTPGLSAARIAALLDCVDDLSLLPELAEAGALAELPGLAPAALAWLAHDDAAAVERDLRWGERPGHAIVGLDDERYPPLLRALPAPPLVLFCVGALERLVLPQVAIVGSRRATAAGVRAAETLAGELVHAGLAVTSGLALGIDAAAHRGALRAGGVTLAVFAQGLAQVYPPRHVQLAEDIVAGGGVLLSEMPPDTAVTRHGFPRRNRVIAGLSLAVLVVEAATRSGSLITARLAGEFGREVLAVPGIAGSRNKRGCHQLLRDGATLVECVDDVLGALPGWSVRAAPPERRAPIERLPSTAVESTHDGRRVAAPTGPPERAVRAALEGAELGFEALASVTGLDTATLSATLTRLELQHQVERQADGTFITGPR